MRKGSSLDDGVGEVWRRPSLSASEDCLRGLAVDGTVTGAWGVFVCFVYWSRRQVACGALQVVVGEEVGGLDESHPDDSFRLGDPNRGCSGKRCFCKAMSSLNSGNSPALLFQSLREESND